MVPVAVMEHELLSLLSLQPQRLAYDPCALFWVRGAAMPQRPGTLGVTFSLITRTWRCLELELKE